MPIKKHTLAFLLILSALMAFTSLSVDIYLPALPAMSHDLRGDAELTVTGFLIGFTLAQLIWGPVADRIGRKTPLAVGMLLFTVGSIGCALSQTLPQIVFWRVFQAFGACVGPMLSRAMIRDLFGASQAARLLSTLVMIMAVAPIVGPLLGGVLLKIASWHAHFWLLAAIGALMFAAVFRLPESLPATRRARTPLWTAFADYRRLLTNRPFMRYTLRLHHRLTQSLYRPFRHRAGILRLLVWCEHHRRDVAERRQPPSDQTLSARHLAEIRHAHRRSRGIVARACRFARHLGHRSAGVCRIQHQRHHRRLRQRCRPCQRGQQNRRLCRRSHRCTAIRQRHRLYPAAHRL